MHSNVARLSHALDDVRYMLHNVRNSKPHLGIIPHPVRKSPWQFIINRMLQNRLHLVPKLFLTRLGLEFWLPLPLVAAGFWLGTTWLNRQILAQTYEPTSLLVDQAQEQVTLSLSLTVASIDAEINRSLGSTEVTIQTTGSTLQELEFEYPFVEFAEVEGAIASELNLSPDLIRSIIRYRIDY